MAKRKQKKKAHQILLVSWNTLAGKVLLTLGFSRAALTAKQAERIADHLLAGVEALAETADEESGIDTDLDNRLRDQLNSEVSAAMGMGGPHLGGDRPSGLSSDSPTPTDRKVCLHPSPAAGTPGSSAALGGTAHLAEELGSVRGTLSEILDQASGGCQPPDSKAGDRRPETGESARQPPHDETLLCGLAEHPTDPGKILINGRPISLGHARNYGVALGNLIGKQVTRAFGATLKASVPSESPALRSTSTE